MVPILDQLALAIITLHKFAITPKTTTKTLTKIKTSHYVTLLKFWLLLFYVINTSKRGRKWTLHLVPLCYASLTSIYNSILVLYLMKFNFKLKPDNHKQIQTPQLLSHFFYNMLYLETYYVEYFHQQISCVLFIPMLPW